MMISRSTMMRGYGSVEAELPKPDSKSVVKLCPYIEGTHFTVVTDRHSLV